MATVLAALVFMAVFMAVFGYRMEGGGAWRAAEGGARVVESERNGANEAVGRRKATQPGPRFTKRHRLINHEPCGRILGEWRSIRDVYSKKGVD